MTPRPRHALIASLLLLAACGSPTDTKAPSPSPTPSTTAWTPASVGADEHARTACRLIAQLVAGTGTPLPEQNLQPVVDEAALSSIGSNGDTGVVDVELQVLRDGDWTDVELQIQVHSHGAYLWSIINGPAAFVTGDPLDDFAIAVVEAIDAWTQPQPVLQRRLAAADDL